MSSTWREEPAYTLGSRLAAWYALLFLGSSLAIGILTYVLLASSLAQRDHDLIRSTLAAYAAQFQQGGLPALDRAIRNDQAASRGERLFVRVSRGGQEVIFYNLPGEWSEFDLSPLERPSGQGGQTWAYIPRRGTSEVLEVASTYLADGTLLQVGKSNVIRSELLARYRTILIIAVAVVVLIGAMGGALLTRSTMRPLRHLAGVVQTILQTGRFDARVPVQGSRDPLDQLGGLFNGMLDRIAALVAGMRGSLDNVAHDLRTPMTRLRAIAERSLESGSEDPERYREALADCLEESERVSEMLNTLMDISEAETGVMRLAPEPVDAAGILHDVQELYADVADDKGIEVRVDAPDGSGCRGRPQPAAPGPGQPGGQRGEVHAGRRSRHAEGAGRRCRGRARRRGRRAGDRGRGSAAHLGPALPRRPEPVRTRSRSRPQPRPRRRPGARGPCRGGVGAGPWGGVHDPPGVGP